MSMVLSPGCIPGRCMRALSSVPKVSLTNEWRRNSLTSQGCLSRDDLWEDLLKIKLWGIATGIEVLFESLDGSCAKRHIPFF